MTPSPPSADDGSDLPPGRRRAITAAIVVIVGLQALTGFKLVCPPRALGDVESLRVACPPTLWPFTDYPMYEASFGPGAVLPSFRVVLELADGSRLPLGPDHVGMTPRRFRRDVIDRLLRQQRGRVQPLAVRLIEEVGPLRAFVVENHPVRMDATGAVELPMEVALRIPIDERGRMP